MRKLGIAGVALLAALYWAMPALAAVPTGLVRNLGLRIECLPDGNTAAGMQFQLYYIASVSEDGEVTVVEPYIESGVTAEMLTGGGYRQQAVETLAEFINGGGAEADFEGTTNDSGTAVIQNLADGIYLCASNTRYVLDGGEGASYTPVPFLFRLNAELVASQTRYENTDSPNMVTAITKFAVTTPGGGGGRGSEPSEPPTDIPDPATPTSGGDGGETGGDPGTGGDSGTGGDPGTSGDTGESTPEPGEDLVEIEDEGPPLDEGIVEIDDQPVPRDVLPEYDEDEDEGGGAAVLDVVDLDDPDVPLAMLPQTGLLWWPVPVMAVVGLVLFLVGYRKYRRA